MYNEIIISFDLSVKLRFIIPSTGIFCWLTSLPSLLPALQTITYNHSQVFFILDTFQFYIISLPCSLLYPIMHDLAFIYRPTLKSICHFWNRAIRLLRLDYTKHVHHLLMLLFDLVSSANLRIFTYHTITDVIYIDDKQKWT